jgi:hypothetical protein
MCVASRLGEKLNRSGFVSGHGFSRADNANKMSSALAPANPFSPRIAFPSDSFRSLFSPSREGYGLQPVHRDLKNQLALAPEGMLYFKLTHNPIA